MFSRTREKTRLKSKVDHHVNTLKVTDELFDGSSRNRFDTKLLIFVRARFSAVAVSHLLFQRLTLRSLSLSW